MQNQNQAEKIAEKIKGRDFSAAYSLYFKAMESGISDDPIEMMAFENAIESGVNNSNTWNKWIDWACEHETASN